MRTWSRDEQKRLAVALHQGKWTFKEMAKVVRSRDHKQCKSHLQKIVDRFRAFDKNRTSQLRDQQSVYSSHLLYLAHCPTPPSPNETLVPINPRPPIQLEEFNPPDHMEPELDFLSFGDLWTTASTSTLPSTYLP